jgi:hypothetical protein
MRTIRTKIYKFEELTKEAKNNAIEAIRQKYYENNDFAAWAIDDCSLFEPLQTELNLISYTGDDFIISNSRKGIYFNSEQSKYLDCAEALNIENEDYFYLWLSIPHTLASNLSYRIYTPTSRNSSTTIEFYSDSEDFTVEENSILDNAIQKFNNHISSVLDRITNDIEYRFTNESILQNSEVLDYEFFKDGKIFL